VDEIGATLEMHDWAPDWGPRLPPFEGMLSPEDLPGLTAELCRRGFGEAELRKIYHENYFRVFKQVLG
jgi:microsomal dipeptidase-like Zn-dependent dipeptidase